MANKVPSCTKNIIFTPHPAVLRLFSASSDVHHPLVSALLSLVFLPEQLHAPPTIPLPRPLLKFLPSVSLFISGFLSSLFQLSVSLHLYTAGFIHGTR
jgi:hypothetical protein